MESDTSTPKAAIRYCCPFPGCNRSFRDFWRLKVHYRAAPGARGSGVERGHGQELPHCPLCLAKLDDVKYHKCAAGPAAQSNTSGNKKSNSSNSQGQTQQNSAAAVNSALVSSGSNPLTAVRPTVTWPQHLSVSTTGPVPVQNYGHGTVGVVGHNGQMLTTVLQQQHHHLQQHQQLQHQQQQQHHQHVVQGTVQPQHMQYQQQQHQMQLPAKQLWVQTSTTNAMQKPAPGGLQQLLQHDQPGSGRVTANVSATFELSLQQQQQQQDGQGSFQQQQQQQHSWAPQQKPAPGGYSNAPGMMQHQQQQQPWQGHHQQQQQQQQWHGLQQQQLPASTCVMTQQYVVAGHAGGELQHQHVQPLQNIANQLLGPALGQLQQQQHDLAQHHLSPVITLPSHHASNAGNNPVYRPSPRLSADGCNISQFLLPRLSEGGGNFGGMSNSQWTSTLSAFTPTAAAAASRQQCNGMGHQGSLALQQQQQQQPEQCPQQQVAHTQQQQQQQLGAVQYLQGGAVKGSNNSGSSSSCEWHPATQAAAAAVAAPVGSSLSGLIQGFAAEMQARGFLQQQQQQQQGTSSAALGSTSTAAQVPQTYGGSFPPTAQPWLPPGNAAADVDGSSRQFGACNAAPAAPELAPPAAAAAAAEGAIETNPADPTAEQLPAFALKIAEEFKVALSALRSSMGRTSSMALQGVEVVGGVEHHQQQQQLGRIGSSSGSNSPVNSEDGKGVLPGSCQSMLLAAGEQQQQQQATAAAGHSAQQQQQQQVATELVASEQVLDSITGEGQGTDGAAAGLKRPLEDSPAAGEADAQADAQQPEAKRQRRPPLRTNSRTGSALLPPLGAPRGSPSKAGANNSPPRLPPATAGGPFAAASAGVPPTPSHDGAGGDLTAAAAPAGLARTCSVWSDTPPPPEAPAALLELAARMQQDAGSIKLPETADGAAQGPSSTDVLAVEAGQAAAVQQQQEGETATVLGPGELSGTMTAAVAAAAQQLLALPGIEDGDEAPGNGQKHRAIVAALLKKATDDARACGLADPSPLVVQLMSVLDEHVSALSQLGDPGTELAVASAGGVTVELPGTLSVHDSPQHPAAPGQCANSAAVVAVAAP